MAEALVIAKADMDQAEIIAPESNGEAAFLGFHKNWPFVDKMAKMVTRGRFLINVPKASIPSKEWSP